MTTYKSIFLGSLLVFTFAGSSFAQQMHEDAALITSSAKGSKILTDWASANKFVSNTISAEYPKLMKHFSTTFQNASNEQWTESDQCLFVSFMNNRQKVRACFSKNGTMNYVITESDPKQLPAGLQERIKNNYTGYSIFNAKKINAYNTTAYQVILEDANEFVTIKSTPEGVEEASHVNKIKTEN